MSTVKSPTLAKKCPRCGHSALEHQLGEPTRCLVGIAGWEKRYCRHPVPIAGKKELFTFCMCCISPADYYRAGNYAMIDVDLPNSKEAIKKND